MSLTAVPHGFRSTFRDWAAEETNHPREVIEAALAHVVQNQVEAAYARSDLFERRRNLIKALGATYLRPHLVASSAVMLRRLSALDYVLDHPDTPWLATEREQVTALTAAGVSPCLLPSRRYDGAVGSVRHDCAHKLPLALDAARATFLFKNC